MAVRVSNFFIMFPFAVLAYMAEDIYLFDIRV